MILTLVIKPTHSVDITTAEYLHYIKMHFFEMKHSAQPELVFSPYVMFRL